MLQNAHGRRSEDTIRDLVSRGQVAQALRRQQTMELADLGEVTAMPGAHDLLVQLARNPQLQWALATSLNGRLLEVRIAAAGLPLPATVVTSDLVVHGKPDPESYRLAAAMLGVPPHECVVIEDSPAGLIAGRAAGATVIAVTHTFPADVLEPHADFVISSLNELRVTGRGLAIGR